MQKLVVFEFTASRLKGRALVAEGLVLLSVMLGGTASSSGRKTSKASHGYGADPSALVTSANGRSHGTAPVSLTCGRVVAETERMRGG
jgi:hypothetical protein